MVDMIGKVNPDVIIPTYMPGREFLAVLRRLEAQSLAPGSIILFNTEKDGLEKLEGFPALMKKYGNIRVRHLKKEAFDHAGTRDAAIRTAEASVVVLMTQDAVPADRFLLERLCAPILRKEAAAAYARQLPKKKSGRLEAMIRQFNYPEKPLLKREADAERLGIKTYFCSNACAAYDRAVYLEQGGFQAPAVFNEDMVFAAKLMKAGYAVAYAAEARVYHSHRYTPLGHLKRNFDLGVSQADHPEVFSGISSESEGGKMLKTILPRLIREGDLFSVGELGVSSIFKLAGYQLGRHYRSLPEALVRELTMNRTYWEKKARQER